MPVKTSCWSRGEPVQLYIILVLTIIFFLTELVLSHISHALTLLLDSYHMLCNIMALTGCIITIKHGKKGEEEAVKESVKGSEEVGEDGVLSKCKDKTEVMKLSQTAAQKEKKLKNTFGWARIDVIAMLICGIFLASLSFSLIIEGFQTLFHIDHQHEVHQPILVLCVGALGLLLNGVCYLLIGGYTFHQGSFLYVTESGNVVLNRVVTNDSIRKGERRLSRTRQTAPIPTNPRQRQGFREMLRDVNGCIFVIIAGAATYFSDQNVAKFVDPILAIISASLLMILSYPYMKESGLILLQTIPNTINIDSMKTALIEHFPDIVNVHDLHIWQFTANKVISTAHIIFISPKDYSKIIKEVREFFLEYGVTQVTIQPEFSTGSQESLQSRKKMPLCLMKCQDPQCVDQHCCPTQKLQMVGSLSREDLVSKSILDLKNAEETQEEETIEETKEVDSVA